MLFGLRHDGDVTEVAFSRDGRWLVTASEDTKVRVWNAVTGERIRVLSGHPDVVKAVAISPDNALIASGGGYIDPKNSNLDDSKELLLWVTDIEQLLAISERLIQRKPNRLTDDERASYLRTD